MIGVQSSAPNFGSYTKNSGEIEKSRRKTSFGDIWMCSLWCAELIASLVACWIIADGIVALFPPSFTELCLWMFHHGNFNRTVVRLRLDYYNTVSLFIRSVHHVSTLGPKLYSWNNYITITIQYLVNGLRWWCTSDLRVALDSKFEFRLPTAYRIKLYQ